MIVSKTHRRSALQAVAVAVALAFCTVAQAEPSGWASKKASATPTMKQLVPQMSSEESYTERYTFSANLDGGGHIGADFTISNLGWGDGQGAVQVRVKLPGQKNYTYSKKVSEGDWSFAKNKFHLDIANTSVTGKGTDRFQIKHQGKDAKFDITFKNTISMWQPGDGRIDTDEGYYKFDVIAPRADISGKVYIGGKWHEVTGSQEGYADHVAMNVAPFDLAKRFMRMRTSKGDVFIIWREITLTEALGGESMTWVMVGYKDKIVFSDPDATISIGKSIKDPKTGYRVPLSVQIDGDSGKDSIKLVVRGKRFKRKDLLASYGSAARAVASTMTEPYAYTVEAKYKLKMTIGGATAVVGGESHFVSDFLN
jgi:hypothetical protein